MTVNVLLISSEIAGGIFLFVFEFGGSQMVSSLSVDLTLILFALIRRQNQETSSSTQAFGKSSPSPLASEPGINN